ncbi:putative MFS family arabinose efflux permease [Actinopolyspora biskrensis]|uniref:Putative MFS family arabinose efflux permease n=1 Tax=Actinopolyspora biskrensis TaxID=1470178 RepID=A0A852YTF4_9ACTN|nr:MFS transporter [Actinopolyspora biskrensis]NYH76849.1 putative MFS family arabinose efflux permease [Actinopolyspora biskrensis]
MVRVPASAAARTAYGPGRVVPAVSGVVTVGILPVFLVGGLGVQLQERLDFGPAVLGLGVAGFFAVAALCSRPMGWVAERIGTVTSLRVAATGSSLCLLGTAVAPNRFWLLAVLWLAGLPNALGQPASNSLIARCVPLRHRATAFGIKQAAIPTATLLSGVAVPTVALTLGWRWAFAMAAFVGVCVVLLLPVRVRSEQPSGAASTGGRGGSPGRGVLLLIATAAGLGSAAANSLGSFVTTTGVHVGFTQASAGMVLVVGSAVGLCMRLAVGVLTDRRNPDPIVLITLMLVIGSAGFALMAFPVPLVFPLGAVIGFGAGWAWPGLLNFAVAALYPGRVAGATSISQTGVYIGGSSGPLLFGVLASHAGLSAAWMAAGGVAVLGAVLLWLARRSVAAERSG